MPVDIIPFEALGRFENNWLDTRYHFSFADYHDPNRMGVGPLRVWNNDRIAPGMGFDPHPCLKFVFSVAPLGAADWTAAARHGMPL